MGCANNDKIPSGLIQKDKMEKILWDMVQADRFVNTFITNKRDSLTDKKVESAKVYERVFQLHGISREEFIKSYKFYLGRPDITKVMFDSITTRAEAKRAELHSPMKKNPLINKRDSLLRLDSIKKQDSIDRMDSLENTSTMSDSALRKALFKDSNNN